jgi:hypothetical protein
MVKRLRLKIIWRFNSFVQPDMLLTVLFTFIVVKANADVEIFRQRILTRLHHDHARPHHVHRTLPYVIERVLCGLLRAVPSF